MTPNHSEHHTQYYMEVIVVGAGLAGLAAAIAIRRSGHRVRVLDQKPQFEGNKMAGIKVAPNFSRVLRNWGLGDALASVTYSTRRTKFISLETGETVGHIRWEDPVMRLMGGDMRLGAFEDVLRLMHDLLAIHYGVEISYGHKVVAYESRSPQDKPAVILEDGRRIEADLIINAAGIASLANISSGFDSISNWRPTGFSAYMAIIPGEKMLLNPELNELLHDNQDWSCWMGSKRFILSYPIKENTAYVLEILCPDSLTEPWPSDASAQSVDCPLDAIDFSDCIPLMNELLKLVTSLQRTRLLIRKEPLSDWANETGRIVAIGGSICPLPPYMLSPLALAIEDASALGVLLSHIQNPSMLPAILAGFQETRQPACEIAAAGELGWSDMLTLTPGPERDARDAQMRAVRDLDREPTEEELRTHWENLGNIFAHDAAEAAEDWWIKWGRLAAARLEM